MCSFSRERPVSAVRFAVATKQKFYILPYEETLLNKNTKMSPNSIKTIKLWAPV
jgi:hypothetical protein